MGGLGSGRWTWHSKKATVENCLVLPVDKQVIYAGLHTSGIFTWRNTATGEEHSSIGYELNTLDPCAAWLRLSSKLSRTGEEVNYTIDLTSTSPHFGGIRWWFLCPLAVNGRPCHRRVGKLYLPPGARYFGCRTCHRLTYRSAQEHDKRVDALVRLPLEALRRAVDDAAESSALSNVLLAMKASSRLRKRVARLWRRSR